ncbi:hypothetical protein [Mesorhizobium sp. WSM2239]|uniref:Uncharacterized protein n=2 Tax=unclassified Mesorhizobium TaxID=325217 RepID=A0AAU8DG97_9HYPH
MKNWRNGIDDIGPPLKHADLRPCFSKIGVNGVAIVIGPGPTLMPAPSSYEVQK